MKLFSVEAEMSALGSALISIDAGRRVAEIVTGNMFWRPAHRLIWKAMKACMSRGVLDTVTLENELGETGLEEAGGSHYLLELALQCPSPANAVYYAKIVAECYEARTYQAMAKQTLEVIENEESTIEALRSRFQAIQVASASFDSPFIPWRSVRATSAPETGISTGIAALDKAVVIGGYPRGQTSVVRATAKGGKTTFMLSSFVHLAAAGHRVLYATFADLNASRLKARAMRNRTGWSYPPRHDVFELQMYDDELEMQNTEWRVGVYDASNLDTGADVETFIAWVEGRHAATPFDAIFVDYAQKLTSSDRRASSALAESNIVSGRLSRMADRLGPAVIVASQITEGSKLEGRKAMTKGSRVWEEDAGLVLTLDRSADDKTAYHVEIYLSRFSPQDHVVPLTYNLERLRFEG